MENKKKDGLWRYIFVGAIFIAACIFYVVMFINLQVSGQDYYSMAKKTVTKTRTVKIQAQRGEIFDRNGKMLVGNKYAYDIKLDYSSMPSGGAAKNEVILNIIRASDGYSDTCTVEEPMYIPITVSYTDTSMKFEYNEEFFETTRKNKYDRLITDLNVKDGTSADKVAAILMERYGITDGDGLLRCSTEIGAKLLKYRLDMELRDFSADNPYTLVKNVPLELISSLSENGVKGFAVFCRAERDYKYPGYASHILGTINKIPSGSAEYYTALGYPLDAVVGISGAEYAFEEYLHGTDGELTVTEDSFGNIISSEITKEPVAGNDVWLTIDIGMQIAAEDALHDNVEYVKSRTVEYNGELLRGEDCEAGALCALDPNTFEVMAIASYPSYNLVTFSEDYKYLSQDNELFPLLNRAVSGTYQPGSTFKPGVAVAALNEKIVNEWSTIECKGVYDYYEGFNIKCWINLLYGLSHGPLNITEALQESCNYFFYEVGRLLTIEKMNEYCKGYGYGEPTGIEINEKTGILAGPAYRSENGLGSWNPGDTLQAAIGQSDNLFTPLQMSVALSTIVNGGTRCKAHLLYKVISYNGDIVVASEPETVSKLSLDSSSHAVVLNAMKDVIEDGSVSELFEDYAVELGGKTGTAQVSTKKTENAIFTAFAPFDSPELAVACVIEQGDTGSNAGFAIKRVFNYYFDLDENGHPKNSETEDNENAENTRDDTAPDGDGSAVDDSGQTSAAN